MYFTALFLSSGPISIIQTRLSVPGQKRRVYLRFHAATARQGNELESGDELNTKAISRGTRGQRYVLFAAGK